MGLLRERSPAVRMNTHSRWQVTRALGALLLLAAAASAQQAATTSQECEEYGGSFDVNANGAAFGIIAGAGEVVLHLNRALLETTNGVAYSVRGTDYSALSLNRDVYLRLSLQGATWPVAGRETTSRQDLETLETDPRWLIADFPANERAHYRDVYPGVDFGVYDDASSWECAFVARAGSSWSNISLSVDGALASERDAAGDMVYHFECGKLVLKRPTVYRSSDGTTFDSQTGSFVPSGSGVRFTYTPARSPVPTAVNTTAKRREPEMALVPAGGSTNGPAYEFHASKFEVTNAEFLDFLNDAEAATNTSRGANMHFDADGNVWINPAKQGRRDELFSLADSRLAYDRTQPAGKRYRLTGREPAFGKTYTNHPVTGVSWYGAVKYCNWLTLATGRSADDLCYREGTNAWDWAPVTCAKTNWIRGRFGDDERSAWLEVKGYRLMMDPGHGTNTLANDFNEFVRAAAWFGKTNTLYGYGRNTVRPGDANYYGGSPSAMRPDTMPVGFFDGSDHDDLFPTRTNANPYGIYDLSGNVDEWVTDLGYTNSALTRAAAGGSWMQRLPTALARQPVRPYETGTARGLRVVTSYSGKSMFILRVPLYVCLCPYQRDTAAEEAAKAKEDEKKETTIEQKLTSLDGGVPSGVASSPSGVLTKETTTGEGEEETVPEEGGVSEEEVPEDITSGVVTDGGT